VIRAEMPQGGWYTWLIVGIGALLWGAAIWWFIMVIRHRMVDGLEIVASREASAFAYSEDRLLEVMERYPKNASPVCAYGQYARGRQDWEEALRRFQLAIARNPRQECGYAGAAAALRGMKRLDESDALLRRAQKRCEEAGLLQIECARNAMVRQNWHEAARRWAMTRQFHPNVKFAYEQGEIALRKAGLVEEAEALAAEKAERFPKIDPVDRDEPAQT
jgi:tetratricopeptide (TPR) repeat protein